MKHILLLAIFFLIVAFSFIVPANAGGRHFTYIYESAAEPKGERELEIWNTFRNRRKEFFRRLDSRIEFELGLTGNLQTSLYLNLSQASFNEDGAMESEQSIGFSNEWKYKILDAVADPIGLGLYGEVGYSSSEIELEGKLILDKKIDNFLFAVNAVGEHSFVSGIDDEGSSITETEEIMELAGGAAYFLTDHFTIGVEAREHVKRPPGFEGGGTYSAFYLGPCISISDEGWWAALSIMPQIGGSNVNKNPTVIGETLELVEHEKLEARLLFSVELGGEEEKK